MVALLQALGELPESRLFAPGWAFYAISVLAAVMQSALVAVATQDRQRAADDAAAEGAAMYRFLADNAMDLITRHSADGRIRFASPAAQTILDRAPESLLGLAPAALVHADDLKVLQAAFVEASYFGRAAAAEVRLKRTDGSYVWTEMRCRPATPVNGTAAEIVAVTRDISERKQNTDAIEVAERQAQLANAAKSRFLAAASHDLRQPLQALSLMRGILERKIRGGHTDEALALVARLDETSVAMTGMLNTMLDINQIEAGIAAAAPIDFPIAGLFDRLRDEFS